MKKLTTISLFIFGVVTAAILTAGLVFYQNNKGAGGNPGASNLGSAAAGTAAGSQITLDAQEVAKHNSAASCWMIINNKVYDVTAAISDHPGGTGEILKYCGQEATNAWDTKDRNRPHSASANNLLDNYYIGDLSQKIAAPQ